VLGALGGTGELSLGSLDDESSDTGVSYARSDGLPGSIGPATARPTATDHAAVDLFVPPDTGDEEIAVELAPDELEHRARKSPRSSPPTARPVSPDHASVDLFAPSDAAVAELASDELEQRTRKSWSLPAAARPAAADHAAVDRFAPPDAADEELAVELAPDELEHRARKRRSSPPVFAPEPPARRSAPVLPSLIEPPLHGSTPLLQSPATMVPSPKLGPMPRLAAVPSERQDAGSLGRRGFLRSPRARFGVGVLLAIVLGFIPAAVVGALRERSAFRAIDARVIAAQAAVDSPQSYEALDELRANQLEAKRSARRMIVITSMLLWAAAGGGLAYVWFKRMPWQRLG